jgi:hypothetical protein
MNPLPAWVGSGSTRVRVRILRSGQFQEYRTPRDADPPQQQRRKAPRFYILDRDQQAPARGIEIHGLGTGHS